MTDHPGWNAIPVTHDIRGDYYVWPPKNLPPMLIEAEAINAQRDLEAPARQAARRSVETEDAQLRDRKRIAVRLGVARFGA